MSLKFPPVSSEKYLRMKAARGWMGLGMDGVRYRAPYGANHFNSLSLIFLPKELLVIMQVSEINDKQVLLEFALLQTSGVCLHFVDTIPT